jgi:predicted ATP-grasp superfamily ATP-dependent carboligase
MTDVTMNEVLSHQDLISRYATVPFADYDTYRVLSNKGVLFKDAQDLGVPMPQTDFVDSTEARERLRTKSETLVYPLVLKPYESRVRTEMGWVGTQVKYAHGCQDIIDYLSRQEESALPFMVQERIQGPGIGIFLLMSKGQVLAQFAHQRVREKPPSGGVSVVCKGIEPPVDALESAKKLLQKFNWTGVVMVEFKRDSRDGMCKLMEVNARFWGSLQLAISSGINFPYLLYCLANGDEVTPQLTYKSGVFSRWELGDLDHLLIRLKGSPSSSNLPVNAPSRVKTCFDFMSDFLKPRTKHEVLKFSDPRPFLRELRMYCHDLISFSNRS